MQIRFTERATLNAEAIYETSVAKFGEQVAEEYLDKIDLSLATILEYPRLLGVHEHIKSLRVYGTAQHILICYVIDDIIYVTAIWYGSMHIDEKISELEPNLIDEATILHERIKQSSNGKKDQ